LGEAGRSDECGLEEPGTPREEESKKIA
jgi:hypothetical protein